MRTAWHLVFVLLPWLAAVPTTQAQELIDRRQRNEYRIEPSGVSLDQAAEMARRRYRAKEVLRAETVRQGERRVHLIRLLSADGKVVWNVRVDAESGAMN